MQFTKAIDHRCHTCNKLFFRGIFAVGILEIKCTRCGNVSLLNAFTNYPNDKNEHSYMLVYNSKGRIILATDNASKHLGFSRHELMSLTIPEISPRNQLYAVPQNADEKALKSWDEYHKELTPKIIHLTKKGNKLNVDAEFHTVASTTDYYAVGLYKVSKDDDAGRNIGLTLKLNTLSAIVPLVPVL
jgi:phage FluMu protein Com